MSIPISQFIPPPLPQNLHFNKTFVCTINFEKLVTIREKAEV